MKKKRLNKVLSLFDGMSCGQLALNKSNIEVDKYYASEIDKHAIKETMANFPKTIQIGDVKTININDYLDVDLIMGGSPCQSFSFAGKREGMVSTTNEEIKSLDKYNDLKNKNFEFKGQSYLFWEYVRILKGVQKNNPNVLFLLENVVMKKEWEDVITQTLGVKPIKIDSSLVSAQCRKRLYWTNIKNINQPKDKNINLFDILDISDDGNDFFNKASIVGRRINEYGYREDYNKKIKIIQCLEVRKTNTNKSNCITTVQKDNVLTNMPIGRHIDVYGLNLPYRNYTIRELCRLQTVPEDYFKVSSDNQIRKMLGNGWTVDVISHIFNHL